VIRFVAQTAVATTTFLAMLAVGTSFAGSSELEYRGAALASPANETVLSSSTGVTLSWSLPSGVAAVKRLKELERENAQLKRLVADKELENLALREISKGNW
jgi:putative transposase